MTRSLGLWLIDSTNTLLNYVPIFLILFALIAILDLAANRNLPIQR